MDQSLAINFDNKCEVLNKIGRLTQLRSCTSFGDRSKQVHLYTTAEARHVQRNFFLTSISNSSNLRGNNLSYVAKCASAKHVTVTCVNCSNNYGPSSGNTKQQCYYKQNFLWCKQRKTTRVSSCHLITSLFF